jgi:hypothetical protein
MLGFVCSDTLAFDSIIALLSSSWQVPNEYSIRGYYPRRVLSATFSAQEEKRSDPRKLSLRDPHPLSGVSANRE